MMSNKDMLIELIGDFAFICPENCKKEIACTLCKEQKLADHLLENSVIVPPCKVGDKVYIITNVSQEIVESIVIGIWLADGVFSILTIHGTVIVDNIGKTVFLTKEEAEEKLKELNNNAR